MTTVTGLLFAMTLQSSTMSLSLTIHHIPDEEVWELLWNLPSNHKRSDLVANFFSADELEIFDSNLPPEDCPTTIDNVPTSDKENEASVDTNVAIT